MEKKVVAEQPKQVQQTARPVYTAAQIVDVMKLHPSKQTEEQTKIYKKVLQYVWDKNERVPIRQAFPGFKKWSEDFEKVCNVQSVAEHLNSGSSRKRGKKPLRDVDIEKKNTGHVIFQVKKALESLPEKEAFVNEANGNKPLTYEKIKVIAGRYCNVHEKFTAQEVLEPAVNVPVAMSSLPEPAAQEVKEVQPAVIAVPETIPAQTEVATA